MKSVWIISKRELQSFFDSLIAYILLVVFLGISGFFTWLFGSDIFLIGQATLQPFFSIAYFTLFFFIPALTMRMLAEEKRSGTIELLLTKPVTDWQVILGKFAAVLFFNIDCLSVNTYLLHNCLVNRANRSRCSLVWFSWTYFNEYSLYRNRFICQ